jgi:hypothetical protein
MAFSARKYAPLVRAEAAGAEASPDKAIQCNGLGKGRDAGGGGNRTPDLTFLAALHKPHKTLQSRCKSLQNQTPMTARERPQVTKGHRTITQTQQKIAKSGTKSVQGVCTRVNPQKVNSRLTWPLSWRGGLLCRKRPRPESSALWSGQSLPERDRVRRGHPSPAKKSLAICKHCPPCRNRPLFLKRYNSGRLNHQAVTDVLSWRRILPLNSPTHYLPHDVDIEHPGERQSRS